MGQLIIGAILGTLTSLVTSFAVAVFVSQCASQGLCLNKDTSVGPANPRVRPSGRCGACVFWCTTKHRQGYGKICLNVTRHCNAGRPSRSITSTGRTFLAVRCADGGLALQNLCRFP